jgi:hypothetical protein
MLRASPGRPSLGRPFDACVSPVDAAGKTCDAMQSYIAASPGSPSLASPPSHATTLFCIPRKTTSDPLKLKSHDRPARIERLSKPII